jgi:geranylgeranyl diphosphate synthase type II
MPQQILKIDTVALVNQALDGFFERSIAHAALIDPSYQQLWENLYNFIRSGGKRLRPQMTMLAYEAFDGTDSSMVIPVAAAQELLHFCLLIHDDIIDRDYIRYGIPNVAGRYKKTYKAFVSDPTDQIHYANSAALLGGDLMLSGAYQLITSCLLPPKDKIVAQGLLGHSTFEVAGGELLDTESSFVPYIAGNALKIARYKTASYSFITPLVTGATLAGASSAQLHILRSYAISLGVAYQLVDDILGTFGSEKEIGKSTSGDIREGKRTYMVEHAIAAMSPNDKKIFDHSFGDPAITPARVTVIRELLTSTGARAETEKAINHYATEAREALALLQLDNEYHDKFEALILKVTKRSF